MMNGPIGNYIVLILRLTSMDVDLFQSFRCKTCAALRPCNVLGRVLFARTGRPDRHPWTFVMLEYVNQWAQFSEQLDHRFAKKFWKRQCFYLWRKTLMYTLQASSTSAFDVIDGHSYFCSSSSSTRNSWDERREVCINDTASVVNREKLFSIYELLMNLWNPRLAILGFQDVLLSIKPASLQGPCKYFITAYPPWSHLWSAWRWIGWLFWWVKVQCRPPCFLSRNCQKIRQILFCFVFFQRSTSVFIHCYKFYTLFCTLLWPRSIIVYVLSVKFILSNMYFLLRFLY